MFEVKDGSRTLQFEGELLASSSSRRKDSIRWIEFELYKTEQGSYILSRIGASLIYHGASCRVVKKYALKESPFSDLRENALACDDCNPDESAQLIFPESYRYWAQVSDHPKAVLEALYKYDDGGARYLTYVARTLLEKASLTDSGIKSIYTIELVP